jgi:GH15 family glucan-1,4-alpha-glucosidase
MTTKQNYLPSNNILQTRYLGEQGALNILDFFPRPAKSEALHVVIDPKSVNSRTVTDPNHALKKWLVRRVECIRGECEIDVEVLPAFNYAQDEHIVAIVKHDGSKDGESAQTVQFRSKNLSLQLNATIDCGTDPVTDCPKIEWKTVKKTGSPLGEAVIAHVVLKENQGVSFILRDLDDEQEGHITTSILDKIQKDTSSFWYNWISKSKYKGRWREVVNRSLMILKMLVYEPTGAIVAAPTFSLPEDFGGGRNWDYRFSWVSIVSRFIMLETHNVNRFATVLSRYTYF